MANIPFPSVGHIPAISGFVGREKEINNLAQFFPKHRIFVIQGLAGSGKTALVAQFAQKITEEQIFDQYKGGLIWISCEESWKFDSLISALDLCLQKQGESSLSVSGTIEDKLRNLIAVLESKPRVLFIDDFHFLDQSRALIMLSTFKSFLKTTKVFIITRLKLELPAIERVDIIERKLEGLIKEEAQLFLQNMLSGLKLSGEEIKKINEIIYEKLHGHPFGIKLFASLLLEDSCSIDELLINTVSLGEEIGSALLHKTILALNPQERELLHSLSFFRKPIRRSLFEKELPPFTTKDRKALEARFLIEPYQGRFFSVPRIVKEYVQGAQQIKNSEDYHKICLDYYDGLEDASLSEKQEAVYHAIELNHWDKAAALGGNIASEMFEKGLLAELVDMAERMLGRTELPPPLAIGRARVLKIFGVNDKSMAILQELLENSPVEYQGEILIHIAGHHLDRGQFKEALDLFNGALVFFENRDDAKGIADVLHELGIIHHYRGDIEMALVLFEQGLGIYEEFVDIQGIAKSKNNIGIMLQQKGRFQEAANLYRGAAELEEKSNNLNNLTGVYHNIANLYRETGELDKALEYYEKSLECSRKTGNLIKKASTDLSIANIYRDKEEYDKANDIYLQAKSIFQEQHFVRGLAFTFRNMGEMFLKRNILMEAQEYTEKAFQLFEESGDLNQLAKTIYTLAKVKIQAKDLSSANKLINRGLSLSVESNFPKEEVEFNIIKAELDLLAGKPIDIIALSELCVPILHEMNHKEGFINLYLLLYRASSMEKNNSNMEKYQQFLKDEISRMPQELRAQYEKMLPFAPREEDDLSYEIFQTGKNYQASRHQAEELRKKKDLFDLWFDGEKKEILEKNMGKISILRRRTVAPLLTLMIKKAGQGIEPRELFSKIWERPYDPETDYATVRVNISRLRKMIEPPNEKGKYIRISDEGGSYTFSSTASYCLILPIRK